MRNRDLIIVIVCFVLFGIYGVFVGRYTKKTAEPESNHIWIDNNRYHKDSIIDVKTMDDGYYIRVQYQESTIYVECVDKEGYTAEEWLDSWLMAFKKEVGECVEVIE